MSNQTISEAVKQLIDVARMICLEWQSNGDFSAGWIEGLESALHAIDAAARVEPTDKDTARLEWVMQHPSAFQKIFNDNCGGHDWEENERMRKAIDASLPATPTPQGETSEQTGYVVGFMFNRDLTHVALIRKQRPEWQKGKLNGIGGHIENREPSVYAMVREFEEETGRSTGPPEWHYYAQLNGPEFKVDVFMAVGELDGLLGQDGEEIEIVNICRIEPTFPRMIENLPWLIALALDFWSDGRPRFAQITYPAALTSSPNSKPTPTEIETKSSASLGAATDKDLGSETPTAMGMVSEDTGLLPCPFCGSNNVSAFEVSEPNLVKFDQLAGTYVWQVECANCGGCSSEFVCSNRQGAKENAINAWNKRADSQSTPSQTPAPPSRKQEPAALAPATTPGAREQQDEETGNAQLPLHVQETLLRGEVPKLCVLCDGAKGRDEGIGWCTCPHCKGTGYECV